MEQKDRETEIMKSQMSSLTTRMDKLEMGKAEDRSRILSLENHVDLLKSTSEAFFVIRRRFFETYYRDAKNQKVQGSADIRQSNALAQEGNAFGDAELFDRDHRTDRSIYRELYGLEYSQVLEYSTRMVSMYLAAS